MASLFALCGLRTDGHLSGPLRLGDSSRYWRHLPLSPRTALIILKSRRPNSDRAKASTAATLLRFSRATPSPLSPAACLDRRGSHRNHREKSLHYKPLLSASSRLHCVLLCSKLRLLCLCGRLTCPLRVRHHHHCPQNELSRIRLR